MMKMWMILNLLFILYIVLSCVTDAADVYVSGYEGRDVKVSCSYDQGYESYDKNLCRNECGNSDVLITTSQKQKKNKYSIYDDKKTRTFIVTISDLQNKDAGKYWCGVTRTGKDIYTEVRVDVEPDSCCDHVTKIQSHVGGSVSIMCPYESKNQNNLKYMCSGKQPSTCLQQAVVISDRKHTTQFTLTDDRKSQFTVNITNLTQKDSGLYLCGIHRNTGLDVFSAVDLEVKVAQTSTVTIPDPRYKEQTSTVTSDITMETTTTHTEYTTNKPVSGVNHFMTYVYILPTVLIFLFIVTFVLVVVYRKKINRLTGSGVRVNTSNTDEVGVERSSDTMYKNLRVAACSEMSSRERQSARCNDDTTENVYQSLTPTEDIYSVCHRDNMNRAVFNSNF